MKKKATHLTITADFLSKRAEMCKRAGYPKQKWIEFCENLISQGYTLSLYEARMTVSKYVTVRKTDSEKTFKVRFSNHRPNSLKEIEKDCDFFVGVTHTGVRNTTMALAAVKKHFS